MKIFAILTLGVVLSVSSFVNAADAPRTIEIKTEKVGEAIHWMPAVVEVTQGESVKFVVKHDVEGGFAFHGFQIAPLKIRKQVDRNKVLTVEATVSEILKPGEYEIGCQFHPKHVPSKLVVKAKPAAVTGAPAKATVPSPAPVSK